MWLLFEFYLSTDIDNITMRWVGLMNTLTAQIEEILNRELICS